MKNRMSLAMIIIISVISLIGCSTGEEDTEQAVDELPELKVDFNVPEEAEVDESVVLTAEVTYGGEAVEGADVIFEYWKGENEENSKEVEPTYQGEGIYKAEVTFNEDANYNLYSHVTAEGLHTMPLESIQVGEGSPIETEDSGDDSESPDGISIHFVEPEQPAPGEDVKLTTQLNMGDTALEAADVRYEIWKKGEKDSPHEWLDAEEITAGEYEAHYAFPEAGTYMINIHIEDGESLHEHQEFELTIE
ncbi:FixH family protein [Virgibacillus sediminis]|uniref:FixH family protein n=1 Tax=Virgibacillus sediminis TaxID=202260 RepID=A0ABV7A2Z5_9BACI